MLKEALAYLSDLARTSAAPQKIHADAFRQIFVIDGTIREVDLNPEPRQHTVKNLANLISLAGMFEERNSLPPLVWYDARAVVLVIDDADRRVQTVTLSLVESAVFQTIRGLRDQRRWLTQKDFVRLLRIDLAGTLDSAVLLDRVRKVKFENGVSTTGTVERSRESMGREFKSSVEVQAGEIPEFVILSVPVYSTDGERAVYGLRCAVEIDAQQGAFQLVPMPDEIERVQDLAVASIAERLNEKLPEDVSAYYGNP